MEGRVGWNGMGREIKDLVTVPREDGVARKEGADLLAKTQGMARHLIGRDLGFELHRLVRLDGGQPITPGSILAGADLLSRSGRQLLQYRPRIADDADFHLRRRSDLQRGD